MSRTKKLVEDLTTPQEQADYGEQRYRDEVLTEHPPVSDVLPTGSIWQAIANFQAEVPILIQNSSASKYTYVDLAEIVRVITPILRKHNLAYIQPLTNESEITTILFHTLTGEQIKSSVKIPIVELDYMNIYQSIGSAISYYRRYSISAMLNLISEKDTDAQGSAKKIQPNAYAPKPYVEPKKSITDEQLINAMELIDKGEYTLEKLQVNYYLSQGQMQTLKAKYGTKN